MTEPVATDLGVARSVLLVGRREFRARLRSVPVLASTIALAVLLAGYLALQASVFAPDPPIRIGLAGQAIGLSDVLPQETTSLGVAVTVTAEPDVPTGLAQLRSGGLDVLVSGARSALTVTVNDQLDARLRATLNSLVRQQVLDAQLAQLGLKPADVLGKVDQAQITVTQLRSTDPAGGQRLAIGLAVAALLTVVLALFGALVVAGLTEQAAQGTAEVLVGVVRPRRLLLGNLAGLGAVGLLQLFAVGLFGALLTVLAGVTSLPGAVFGGLFAGLLWFGFGFALYGTGYAICTSAADRVGRARQAVGGWRVGWWGRLRATQRLVLAGTGGLLVVFVVSAVVLALAPGGAVAGVLSVLPPFAPILLPARMAMGAAAGWQVFLAMVLTLGAVTGLAWRRP